VSGGMKPSWTRVLPVKFWPIVWARAASARRNGASKTMATRIRWSRIPPDQPLRNIARQRTRS